MTKDGKTNTDTYTYDVEGNRLTKTTNGKLTKYIVDSNGLSQVLAELDENGSVTAEYTHGAEIVSQSRNGIKHYYLFDGNGNIRMLTDVEGAVTDTYDYDSYGIATASTGLTVNSYRYCGEYQDETTGLYYLRARYYDSATGRFISADSYGGTISDPVSLHKYLYANANPIMNSDPTGNFTLVDVTAATAANSILLSAGASSIIGGFFALIDALAGGCHDPIALCNSYFWGASFGFVTGAVFGECIAYIQMGGRFAAAIQIALGSITSYFAYESFSGAADSFQHGKYAQAAHRAGMGLISTVGAITEFGGAYDTITNNSNTSVGNDSIPKKQPSIDNNIINDEKGVGEYLAGKAPKLVSPGTHILE